MVDIIVSIRPYKLASFPEAFDVVAEYTVGVPKGMFEIEAHTFEDARQLATKIIEAFNAHTNYRAELR